MEIRLNNKILDDLDISKFLKVCPDYDIFYHFFNKRSGEAHYRLLSYLSCHFQGANLIDIGTNKGSSALALSYYENNNIFSFDLRERFYFIEPSQEYQVKKGRHYFYFDNVKFIIGNFYHFKDLVLKSNLILYDTNYDGILEREFLDWLITNKYEGILLLDDIKLNPEMVNFWDNIKLKKYDISKYGNQSGTGLIDFSNKLELILE